MDEGLLQLIFLALVLVGWLIRAAAEARQRRQKPRPPEEAVDRPAPSMPPPRYVPPPAPPPETIAEHAEHVAYGGLTGLHSTSWAGTSVTHDLTAAQNAAGRHQAALRRLAAGLDVQPSTELVRAGILWSEVLGPCRAVRGPHRPPTLTRRRS